MKKINYKLLIVFLLITLQSSLFGATYYVSTAGDDSNLGTKAAPWRTITHGVNNMAAGSTLYIRGGIYTFGDEQPIKAGISDSQRTVISSYSGETVRVTKGYFQMIGIDYWTVNGIDFIYPATARAYFGISVRNCSHVSVTNNKFHETQSSGISFGSIKSYYKGASREEALAYGVKDFVISGNDVYHTNYNTLEESLSVACGSRGVISHNKVYNSLAGRTGTDYNCLMLDVKTGSNNIDIHHNEIWQTEWGHSIESIGIYIDGIHYGVDHIDVHHNHVWGITQGIRITSESRNDNDRFCTDNKCYNNVIHDILAYGIALGWGTAGDLAGASLLQRNYVYNNTIYDVHGQWGTGIHVDLTEAQPGVGGAHAEDNYIYNNIVWNCVRASILVGSDPHNSVTIDTNVASSPILTAGTNRINGDPLFVDASQGDFNLKVGSSAIDASKAATGEPWFALGDDFNGKPRQGGNLNDIGAYERQDKLVSLDNKSFIIKEDGLYRSN